MAKNYEHLKVWQKAVELAVFVYKITARFPKEELYGLTNQLRRATVSISSNIAEGAGRHSKREFLQFIFISLGSLNECESQIHVSFRLGYLPEKDFMEAKRLLEELGNLLGGLRNYLRK